MTYQRDYSERLRLGIVGLGSHAYRNILPALHFLPVRPVAFCDVNLNLALATAPEFGVAHCYTSLSEMIAAGGIDAVLLCVGERHHPDLACEAFDAGLHVWMEKPAAMSVAEVERMLRHRGDRVCVVGMKKAFMPATTKAIEMFSRKPSGPVRSVLGVYPIGLPEDGSSLLADPKPNDWLNCCHPLAFMLAVGGPVATVTAIRGRKGGGVVLLDFASGAHGTLHLAEGAPYSQPIERYTVIGQNCHLTIDNVERVTFQRGIPFRYGVTSDFAAPGDDSGAIVWEPQHTLGTLENKTDFTHGMVPELAYFCDCIFAHRMPRRGSLEFALHAMRIYEASLPASGRPVPLPRDGSEGCWWDFEDGQPFGPAP
jgi:predicted dehydrogenase